MGNSPDYKTIRNIIDALKQLGDDSFATLSRSFTETTQIVYDHRTKCIVDVKMIEFIKNNASLIRFLNNDNESGIPLELYLLLYFHKNFKTNIGEPLNYKSILETIRVSDLGTYTNIPFSELGFFSLSYYLISSNVNWNQFTSSFDGKDWDEIDLFQLLLPIGKLTLDDFCNWIITISKEQENDGAVQLISESIEKFIVESSVASEVETNIKRFASEKYLNSFLPAVLNGLKTKQQKPNDFYYCLLKDEINATNCYIILFGIGRLNQRDENGNSAYFSIIDEYYGNSLLDLKGYLALCTFLNFYNDVVYGVISRNLADLVHSNSALDLIRYIYNAQSKTDIDCLTSTLLVLFTVNEPKITVELDSLLVKVSKNDIDLALTILENRFECLGGANLLENVILAISVNHKLRFQRKFIAWLNSEIPTLHLAIGKLTLIHSLNRNLFDIPKEIYAGLSFSEKLFVGCKAIGYIHAKEPLQKIFISLIKSVTTDNEEFSGRISHLLIEYLIYNYRGTLKLIESELKEGNLTPFAENTFKDAISIYEKYFDDLKRITIKKELVAPVHLMQLKNFYQRKQFETIEKNTKKGFFQGCFNNVYLNSNKWAIRRPNELQHVVSELGTVSASVEFPSGEILNPFHQESIRRYYQKIMKNEVNIN